MTSLKSLVNRMHDAWTNIRIHRSVQAGPTSRFNRFARAIVISRSRDRVSVGNNCVVAGELLTFADGGMIEIGDWCYVGEGSRIWSAQSISIGHRVLISHNVNIHDTNSHPMCHRQRHAHFRRIQETGHSESEFDIRKAAVSVGNDVWIGFGATVLKA